MFAEYTRKFLISVFRILFQHSALITLFITFVFNSQQLTNVRA